MRIALSVFMFDLLFAPITYYYENGNGVIKMTNKRYKNLFTLSTNKRKYSNNINIKEDKCKQNTQTTIRKTTCARLYRFLEGSHSPSRAFIRLFTQLYCYKARKSRQRDRKDFSQSC